MTSPQESLANLAKINRIKAEKSSQAELTGLIVSAQNRLKDAQRTELSPDSRFSLAYDAAHSLALAALRWHGYRSEHRYTVFQALAHTLELPAGQWRFLDDCHTRRNVALYDGDLVEDVPRIEELIVVCKELVTRIEKLPPLPD